MTCGVYFSTERRCPLNDDPLWSAGHTCAATMSHDGQHRCACGETKERPR